MANFWLSTEQIAGLNSPSTKYRTKLLIWIMTMQNFGSLTREEHKEARSLIDKMDSQNVQEASHICDYCSKSFEAGGASCSCGRLCCSSKCDAESHKKYKCSSLNLNRENVDGKI